MPKSSNTPSAVQNKVLERENAELKRRLQANGEVGYVSGYEPTVMPQTTHTKTCLTTHTLTEAHTYLYPVFDQCTAEQNNSVNNQNHLLIHLSEPACLHFFCAALMYILKTLFLSDQNEFSSFKRLSSLDKKMITLQCGV